MVLKSGYQFLLSIWNEADLAAAADAVIPVACIK